MNDNETTSRTTGLDPLDAHVGTLIRKRRRLLSLDEAAVSGQLGIALTDYLAIEAGRLRPAASHLAHIAQLLGMSVEDFFRHMPEIGTPIEPRASRRGEDTGK